MMSSQPEPQAGTLIGAYRLTELIGKGGFSEVWSAWDTRLQRLVAIKILRNGENAVDNTEQFNREALIVSRLEHPHVLPLYDFGEASGFRYLVMRYLTGGSLALQVSAGPMPPAEILRYMTPIASALDYIHEHRIVHRDLKPNNILLDAQKSPYLADFGVSKELTDATQQIQSVSGTLTYMSPEQVSSQAITVNSDHYSLGLMLYQLFTGSLPMGGQVVFSLRQLNFGERLPDVTSMNPQLPAGLNDILLHLTELEPQARPKSAVEVIVAIGKLFPSIGNDGAPGFSAVLESPVYRQREAELLLKQPLADWDDDGFTLSQTHFILLDMLLRTLPTLHETTRSLMLRAALEYDHQIEYWWNFSSDAERKRACWDVLAASNIETSWRTIPRVVGEAWARETPPTVLDSVGKSLFPVTDFSPMTLDLLEAALPPASEWRDDESLHIVDENLSALAKTSTPLGKRAAVLIGTARRMRAVKTLPHQSGQFGPLLTVYETAGSLPKIYSWKEKIILFLGLAFRQFTRQPLAALGQYAWTAAGNMLGIGLMVYVVLRSYSLIGNIRLLNTFGQGLLFGMIYAVGIWLARHISQNLRLIPLWVRALLGTALGGLVVATGFTLFQRLVYDDVISPAISITCGLLYVWGFAISVELPTWTQFILGAGGVIAAFLVPWPLYVNSLDADVEIRPPFIFDLEKPETIVPLVVTAALLIALITLGYRWRRYLARKRTPAT